MSYDYQTQRARIFTESGITLFVQIRDRVKKLLAESGAFTMGAAIKHSTGDSWDMLACVDRLVEMGEIEEVKTATRVIGQQRLFVAAGGL